MAIQIPLDDMSFIYSQIERAIGKIILAHPPDTDSTRPTLVNARFDVDPEARGNMKDKLWVITSKGDELEVKLACSSTPKCRICKQFFHVEAECRKGGGQHTSRGNEAMNANQQPAQSRTGKPRERRSSYRGPLGLRPSQNGNAGGNSPAGVPTGITTTLNLLFSPGALQQQASAFNMMQLAAALYAAHLQGLNGQFCANWMQQAQQFGMVGGGLPFQGSGMAGRGFGMPGFSAFHQFQPGQGHVSSGVNRQTSGVGLNNPGGIGATAPGAFGPTTYNGGQGFFTPITTPRRERGENFETSLGGRPVERSSSLPVTGSKDRGGGTKPNSPIWEAAKTEYELGQGAPNGGI
ncbi:hypothetical protein CBR_g31410 [Chara braunii]|uniref:Uncharacterized protein n=1 Tax=Chara braunii TaxID=69332 RepID=A0A388LEX9_CHABU|nr:hypothetical protein CBR_g31410 [Chara braunii]|eukprot:GBG80855.1 hypothetical protein CBR_g31410 [Chara braunii]